MATLKEMTLGNSNVFNFAMREEKIFEYNMKNLSGYERQTTFANDLAIAEWCEVRLGEDKALYDTYKRVMREWIGNIKYITEFVLVLNFRCNLWFQRGDEELSARYSEMYYDALGLVRQHFKDDEEQLLYFEKTID